MAIYIGNTQVRSLPLMDLAYIHTNPSLIPVSSTNPQSAY